MINIKIKYIYPNNELYDVNPEIVKVSLDEYKKLYGYKNVRSDKQLLKLSKKLNQLL